MASNVNTFQNKTKFKYDSTARTVVTVGGIYVTGLCVHLWKYQWPISVTLQ